MNDLLDRCLTGDTTWLTGDLCSKRGGRSLRSKIDNRDSGIGKVGYEINFNRVFFQYQPPRPLEEINAEVEKRILELLREVTE